MIAKRILTTLILPLGPMTVLTEKTDAASIERCVYRRVTTSAVGTTVTCRLVADVLETFNAAACHVSDDMCRACCRSFPPSRDLWNPVVASKLYDAARQVLETSLDEAARDRAADVRTRAESALDHIFEPVHRITPLRETSPCCYLGDAIESSTDGENGNAETQFECRHAAHEFTTPETCRGCRDFAVLPPISPPLRLDQLVPRWGRRSGARVERWAVGVTTSPRKQPTLDTCLDAVTRAGFDHVTIFADGNVRLPERGPRHTISRRDQRIGAWPAWHLALAELIQAEPSADAYLMLQDDAYLHDRNSLREYLERVLWPGERPSLVSLYYPGSASESGWRRHTGPWIWGALAYILPPELARQLVADPIACQQRWDAATTHLPIPTAVDRWAHRASVETWYPFPSLVQHIGNTSTIWTNSAIAEERCAAWYSGSVETPFAAEQDFAGFPEPRFPCVDGAADAYQTAIAAGRRRMHDADVVITGLCRDVRMCLPRFAARVERLGSMFRDYHVVLYENDSTDRTLEFLHDWQALNPRVHVHSETLNIHRFPQARSLPRAAHLAACRNHCRTRIVQDFAAAEFVIVADSDLLGGWSYDGIAHTFGHADWDFVGSYGLIRRPFRSTAPWEYQHFDTWAFRPDPRANPYSGVDASELALPRGGPLLPVHSCFGGLGIYRAECLHAAEYSGEDCEHVALHTRLRERGFDRLFLNPSQIVLYTAH